LLEKIAEKSLLMVLFFCGLLGICIVSVLGNFINLFFPLGQEISLVILVVGLLLAIINIKIIPRIKSNEILLPIVAFFICFGLAQIGYPTFGGDTLTYHIQIVKWTQESKTPIGLVHLFERLASNNSLFTVAVLPSFVVMAVERTGSISICDSKAYSSPVGMAAILAGYSERISPTFSTPFASMAAFMAALLSFNLFSLSAVVPIISPPRLFHQVLCLYLL
jgi:hypothetical protein